MAHKLALVIGNSEYQDPALARLKAPDADVRALTELLRHPAVGQFDDVVPLVNASEAATRRAVASFFARAAPDDLLLLYFSGHGVLDDKGRLYLAAHDTQRDLLQATAISTAFVTDAMDGSRSRRQVLILDCCHSGAFGRGARAAADAKAVTEATFEGIGYGRAVLTATDATQYAWEGEAVIGAAENSVFTHFMIEGLRTGAADTDGDGNITLEELYTYIYGEVVKRTPKQTPRKWSYNQQGEFLIARNAQPRAPQPLPLPPDLQQSIDDLRPWVREGSVRELERLLAGSGPGLALAARAALDRLKDDDSHRVAQAAAEALQRADAPPSAPLAAAPPAASPAAPPPVRPPKAAPAPAVEAPVRSPAPQAAAPEPEPPQPAWPVAPVNQLDPEAAPFIPATAAPEPEPPQPAWSAAPVNQLDPEAAPFIPAAVVPFPAVWQAVLLIAAGWGLSRGIMQAILPDSQTPVHLVWFINWVLGGAGGGLVIGLVLRRELHARGPVPIGRLVAVWASAWALSWMLPAAITAFIGNYGVSADDELLSHLGLAVGGALGGLGLAACLRPLLPGLRARRFVILALGWGLGWLLADSLATAIHGGSNWLLGWLVGGLVGGLAGGAVTVWQVRAALNEPALPAPPVLAPLPALTATVMWQSIVVTAFGWGVGLAVGTFAGQLLSSISDGLTERGLGSELQTVMALMFGAAIGNLAIGLALHQFVPRFGSRQIRWAAMAGAGSVLVGWMTATSLQTFAYELSLPSLLPAAVGLGLATGGALGSLGLTVPLRQVATGLGGRPFGLIALGWAVALGIVYLSGMVIASRLNLDNTVWEISFAGLVGLAVGLIIGAVTFWQLAHPNAPPAAA